MRPPRRPLVFTRMPRSILTVESLFGTKGRVVKAAIDTVWVLMDPAVFDRLTRQRHWTLERDQGWFAGSVRRLLLADSPPPPTISARSST